MRNILSGRLLAMLVVAMFMSGVGVGAATTYVLNVKNTVSGIAYWQVTPSGVNEGRLMPAVGNPNKDIGTLGSPTDVIYSNDVYFTQALHKSSSSSNISKTWTVANGSVLRITSTVAANIAWVLPNPATLGAGGEFEVVDQSGNLDATHAVNMTVTGGNNINGAASKVFSTAYGRLKFESNGTNLFAH